MRDVRGGSRLHDQRAQRGEQQQPPAKPGQTPARPQTTPPRPHYFTRRPLARHTRRLGGGQRRRQDGRAEDERAADGRGPEVPEPAHQHVERVYPAGERVLPAEQGRGVNAGRRRRLGFTRSADGKRHAPGRNVTIHPGEDAPDDRVRAVGEIGRQIEQQRQRLARRRLGRRVGQPLPRRIEKGYLAESRLRLFAEPQLHPAGRLMQHRANRRLRAQQVGMGLGYRDHRLIAAKGQQPNSACRDAHTDQCSQAPSPSVPPGARGHGVTSGSHVGRLARPSAARTPPLHMVERGPGGEIRIRSVSTG